MFYILSALVMASCSVTRAVADDLSPIAVVEYSCKSSKGPTAEEDAASIRRLKALILDKYIASLGPQKQPLVLAKKPALNADMDGMLQNFSVRSRDFDKKTKIGAMSAQADVNEAKVNQLIDAGPGERGVIVFIFAARRQVEVETRGPKVTTGSQQGRSATAEASTQSRAGETSATTASRTAESTTTVDSVTRTSDRIVYSIEDNAKAGIDRTMSKVFVDRGFDTASPADLVEATKGAFNPDKLQKDFETSSQFSMESQRMATRSCREAGAAMLAYGTLTIGIQRKDPANARNVIVNVVVDAQILDCRKALAIKVGSIGALQVEGVGADQTQAETAALDSAASKAAQVLADQLRSRGVR